MTQFGPKLLSRICSLTWKFTKMWLAAGCWFGNKTNPLGVSEELCRSHCLSPQHHCLSHAADLQMGIQRGKSSLNQCWFSVISLFWPLLLQKLPESDVCETVRETLEKAVREMGSAFQRGFSLWEPWGEDGWCPSLCPVLRGLAEITFPTHGHFPGRSFL